MADEFVRVKDTQTGAEFSAHPDSHYAQENWTFADGSTQKNTRFKVIDKPATGVDGRPLDAKTDPLKKAEEAAK